VSQTDAKARLQRAIDYWIEHDPVPTKEEIKRVAKKFMVRWEDLETAIKMRSELQATKRKK
jgi:hypothetical protein